MRNTVDTKPIPTLTTRFETNTEWVVITGAPSAGKSSVLKCLAERGYETKPEVARDYFESQVINDSSIRSDEALFQRKITKKKVELENSLNTTKRIFLDRGIPDSLTYYRVAGLDPREAVEDCHHFHYKKVFLFERLPFHDDGVRNEDDTTSNFIHKWLEIDYRALGYEITSVPVMSIRKRAELVIKKLSGG